LVLTLL
jgi:small subunit ribosomal protein S12